MTTRDPSLPPDASLEREEPPPDEIPGPPVETAEVALGEKLGEDLGEPDGLRLEEGDLDLDEP